jgi:hypothetical protein
VKEIELQGSNVDRGDVGGGDTHRGGPERGEVVVEQIELR